MWLGIGHLGDCWAGVPPWGSLPPPPEAWAPVGGVGPESKEDSREGHSRVTFMLAAGEENGGDF